MKRELRLLLKNKIFPIYFFTTIAIASVIVAGYFNDVKLEIFMSEYKFIRNCAYLLPVVIGIFSSIFIGEEYEQGTINSRLLLESKLSFEKNKIIICLFFGLVVCVFLLVGYGIISGGYDKRIVILLALLWIRCIATSMIVLFISKKTEGYIFGLGFVLFLFFLNTTHILKYSPGNLYMDLVENLLNR